MQNSTSSGRIGRQTASGKMIPERLHLSTPIKEAGASWSLLGSKAVRCLGWSVHAMQSLQALSPGFVARAG